MANKLHTKVMIVEDVAAFREVLELQLSLDPYMDIVHTSSTSGEAALKAFLEVSQDLVLLDFRLPGIDGLETARRMKEQNSEVKIALVTAYSEEAMALSAKASHVEEVIPKASFSLARIKAFLARN